MVGIRSIALCALVAVVAAFSAVEAADKPSLTLPQSLSAGGLTAQGADGGKFVKRMLQIRKSGVGSLTSTPRGTQPFDCLAGLCWCHGENSADCDLMFAACDLTGGLWGCSSDSGGGDDICWCEGT